MASIDPFQDIVTGYPKLAAKIEIQPEAAIYRRFGALNAQNLLYFQAELRDLEEKLGGQQKLDHGKKDKGSKALYAKNWFRLQHSQVDGDTEQLDLVLKIRDVLKEYNHALIQQSIVLHYPKPGKWDLHHVQDYLQLPEMGPLALTGDDATIWGSVNDRKSHAPDLITLCPRADKDAFSTWAADKALLMLSRCGCTRFMKRSRVHGVVGYEDKTIYRITYWIASIVASLIPIVSIVILYCVQSMPAKFAIIAGFNVLLSICLMAFTRAKRADIFAIAAAFAAVQVVFVGQGKIASG